MGRETATLEGFDAHARPPAAVTTLDVCVRPHAAGKFIWRGAEKVYVRGATYGTFRANSTDGTAYPEPPVVARDFRQMAANGFNAVRTYTVPPHWVLDLAAEHGLLVMVGIPWEHHVPFLDDRARVQSIEERVRAAVRACAGHPAILCYAVGNEIRSQIVRWHGARPVERFLGRLHQAAKSEDPEGLVTYVNYPSTEYLELPFLDIASFNVYLEARDTLEAYLARLHNVSGDRPLILAELGLDSRRNGEDAQARTLEWQIRSTFESGCAGTFVFAWTDEWHMDQGEPGEDFPVDDWDFGLTDRDRRPKAALAAVTGAFSEIPFAADSSWPRVSVVVCTHNGARTLSECLDGLEALAYPNFEVIVVSDGSTDATVEIVERHGFRLIRRERVGLAGARNAGLEAADGEIVAYIDDDARPDPDWLTYIADSFRRGSWDAVGGPNLPPGDAGWMADAVASSPGGPTHVLVSDREAEHIPGCNMAFRKHALAQIGGFDPVFRTAGDDVDICWRLRDRGLKLGFNPAAVVWHRRRGSLRAYWRQQRGYGEAEALVERKWPHRYNGAGHPAWSGRLYGGVRSWPSSLGRRRVHYGKWGTGMFQSLYGERFPLLGAMPLVPEWYLGIMALAVLTALGVSWPPLFLASIPLVLAAAATLFRAWLVSARVVVTPKCPSSIRGLRFRAMVALLHLAQPAARLLGRLRGGLTPWRARDRAPLAVPRRRRMTLWSESWRPVEERIRHLERVLEQADRSVLHGGEFDRWDLEVRRGRLGSARILMAIEDYPRGRQLVRWRLWPRFSLLAVVTAVACGALAVAAASGGGAVAAVVLAVLTTVLLGRAALDAAAATGSVVRAFEARQAPARGAKLVVSDHGDADGVEAAG
jgi:O-antigen biosynthesis protein